MNALANEAHKWLLRAEFQDCGEKKRENLCLYFELIFRNPAKSALNLTTDCIELNV